MGLVPRQRSVDATFKAIDRIVGIARRAAGVYGRVHHRGSTPEQMAVRIRAVTLGDTGAVEAVFWARPTPTSWWPAPRPLCPQSPLAAQQATAQAMAEEVRQMLEEMRARYGSAHTGDFMGFSAMRDEELRAF